MRVVTAFCLACVCAELLVQLVEAGWARRCIKVVAGLYILTVLLRATSVDAAGQPGTGADTACAVSAKRT